jgi:acylphosphatase
MKQAHIFVSGYVQGVGFRQFVKSNARKLGLTGWVRNLSDGRVEAVFLGEQNTLEEMISLCHKGVFLSEVKGVQVAWENPQEQYKDFMIR